MNFDYTEEQQSIRKMIQDFTDKEIVPFAGQWDKEEKFPGMSSKNEPARYFWHSYPEEYGGGGFDNITHAIVAEELEEAVLLSAGATPVDLLVAKLYLLLVMKSKNKNMSGLAAGKILAVTA